MCWLLLLMTVRLLIMFSLIHKFIKDESIGLEVCKWKHRCNPSYVPDVINVITATSNDRHGYSNCRSIECLFNRLFRLTTNEHQMSVLLGLCEGNPPVTSGFPSQRASKAENVSIWWRYNMSSTLYDIWHGIKLLQPKRKGLPLFLYKWAKIWNELPTSIEIWIQFEMHNKPMAWRPSH